MSQPGRVLHASGWSAGPLAGLLVVAAGLVLGIGSVVANAHSAASTHVRRVRHAARPELLSLRYGRFRPQGAPHAYLAFKLTVYEPGGQVVETDFHELPSGFNADGLSRCGIGGRKSGRVETFFVPVSPPLARGRHRLRVTALGSSCKWGRATAPASRIFNVVAS